MSVMDERPSLDEALESIGERCDYAVRLATEAYRTDDSEDETGKTIDPIHRYAEYVVRRTVPLAIIGLFLVQARAALNPEQQGSTGHE